MPTGCRMVDPIHIPAMPNISREMNMVGEDILVQRRLYPEITANCVIAWRRNIPYSQAVTDNDVSSDTEQVAEHDINVYGSGYTDGDKFEGLTRKVGFDRMIPPHALEVAFNKTTHVIFPSEIVYVDLGDENLVAGLADGAKNVLRVKSAVKSFKSETNLTVITDDGCFFTFNVKFAKEPLLLNIEMTDFIHDGEAVNRPNNAQEIYLERLGQESPMLVKLIMKSHNFW